MWQQVGEDANLAWEKMNRTYVHEWVLNVSVVQHACYSLFNRIQYNNLTGGNFMFKYILWKNNNRSIYRSVTVVYHWANYFMMNGYKINGYQIQILYAKYARLKIVNNFDTSNVKVDIFLCFCLKCDKNYYYISREIWIF